MVLAGICDISVYSGRIHLRSYHVVGAETCSEDERGERKLKTEQERKTALDN
jgi:hypothetical protein